MDKAEPMFILNKPKWNWIKIDSELKTILDGKVQKISLKPTMTFEGQNEEKESTALKLRAIIDTEKSLQYENEVGWNWHKSSNLPIISVKFEIRNQDSENMLNIPQGLEITQAQIFAVKIIVNTLERDQIAYLEDIGIRGKNKIDLKEGCGIFSGIRFLSTSYNNEGVKFYLLIIIKSRQAKNPYDSIICSMMSPPIFVDSRKSARDYQEKKFLSFVELFHPDLFQKDFTKRETKSKSDAQIQIGNSLEGLYNYLTAPNIRHKVKHPLFLSIKFSNVFKILYNTKHEYFQKANLSTTDLLRKLQKKLIKEIGGEKKNKKMEKDQDKPFMISLLGQCRTHRKSKVYGCLEYLDCRAIQLVQYAYQINSDFKDISEKVNVSLNQNDVVESYTEIYQQLQKISSREISARKNKEEEQITENVEKDELVESDLDEEDLPEANFIQDKGAAVKSQVKVEDNIILNPSLENYQPFQCTLPAFNQINQINQMNQMNQMNSLFPISGADQNILFGQNLNYEPLFVAKNKPSELSLNSEERRSFKKESSENSHSEILSKDKSQSSQEKRRRSKRIKELNNEENNDVMSKMRIVDDDNIIKPIVIFHQNEGEGKKSQQIPNSAFNLAIDPKLFRSSEEKNQNNNEQLKQLKEIPPITAVINPLLTQIASHSIIQQQKQQQQQQQQEKSLERYHQAQLEQIGSQKEASKQNLVQKEKQRVKNEMLSHLSIQNNILKNMIISNEVMKGKIQTLFHMEGEGQNLAPQQREANENGMNQNYYNFVMRNRHHEEYEKEKQHQAHLVQMAQNFQIQMNQMAVNDYNEQRIKVQEDEARLRNNSDERRDYSLEENKSSPERR